MRTAIYMLWKQEGEDAAKIAHACDRSRVSLAKRHPDMLVRADIGKKEDTLLRKAKMLDIAEWGVNVFLDADTVVMSDLSFGFEMAEKHGIACCICECPWARRYPSMSGDAVEYNTGVIFFDKRQERVRRVFDRWGELASRIDSSITYGNIAMPRNDQASFALAMQSMEFNPFVLPLNWNFRPIWQRTWFGPLKIWHDYGDPAEALVEHNESLNAMQFNTVGAPSYAER